MNANCRAASLLEFVLAACARTPTSWLTVLLIALVLAGCGSTPSASPGPATLTSPAISAVVPSAPATPYSTAPSPTTTAPTAPPGTTPPRSTSWPYAAAELGTPVFGPDGTAYALETLAAGAARWLALDPSGRARPGWPVAAAPGSSAGDPLAAPDGSILAEECGGPEAGCVLHRFGPDGRDLPGWPFREPPFAECLAFGGCLSDVTVGSDGTAHAIAPSEKGGQQLIAIDATGQGRPGWPIPLDTSLDVFRLQLGPDGTVFVSGSPDAPEETTTIWAFGPDGNPRTGWPVSVPASYAGYVPSPRGGVVAISWIPVPPDEGGLCSDASRTIFTVFGPDGRTLPGWPREEAGYASRPVVVADGTVFYLTERDQAIARDLSGEVRSGWPVSVDTGGLGCEFVGPYVSPDGTVFSMVEDVVAMSSAGLRWRYLPPGALGWFNLATDGRNHPEPAFASDDTLYFVVYHQADDRGWAEIAALDADGRARPGWPYRLPVERQKSDVGALRIAPDDHLYVTIVDWAGRVLLLALDPDGRLSH